MIKIRAKLRDALNPAHEILIFNQRPVETFPADYAQLVKRVGFICFFQIRELDVVKQHLTVGTAADDERGISGDARCRSRRWLPRRARQAGDHNSAAGREANCLPGVRAGRRTGHRRAARADRGRGAEHSIRHAR